jgi:molybdopterin-biosynthesis enzyme MoeA-like protein
VALEEILSTVAKAPRLSTVTQAGARLREEQILSRLARRFLVSEVDLRRRLAELRRQAHHPDAPPLPAQATAAGGVDARDQALVELILARPEWIERIAAAVPVGALRWPACQTIYATCMKLVESGLAPDFDRLILECEDPEIRSLLFQIDESSRAKAESDWQMALDQILESYRRRKEDVEHRQKVAALREAQPEAHKLQALQELIGALQPRHRRSDPTDG